MDRTGKQKKPAARMNRTGKQKKPAARMGRRQSKQVNQIRRIWHVIQIPQVKSKSVYFLTSSRIRLATWTPLAEAWDREWVTPLPSPIT